MRFDLFFFFFFLPADMERREGDVATNDA